MPVSDSAPRLNFLRDSAHCFDSLSPSTAAFLRSAHNQILHSQFKSLNQRQKDTFCGACGNIRSPEKTKTIEIKKKPVSRVSKRRSDGATIYKCLCCHRRTIKPTRRDPRIQSSVPQPNTETGSTSTIQQSTESPSQQPGPQPVAQLAQGDRPSKSTENASSKKRAKTRKGGLQALMASKQQSQPSLDLFDFLQ